MVLELLKIWNHPAWLWIKGVIYGIIFTIVGALILYGYLRAAIAFDLPFGDLAAGLLIVYVVGCPLITYHWYALIGTETKAAEVCESWNLSKNQQNFELVQKAYQFFNSDIKYHGYHPGHLTLSEGRPIVELLHHGSFPLQARVVDVPETKTQNNQPLVNSEAGSMDEGQVPLSEDRVEQERIHKRAKQTVDKDGDTKEALKGIGMDLLMMSIEEKRRLREGYYDYEFKPTKVPLLERLEDRYGSVPIDFPKTFSVHQNRLESLGFDPIEGDLVRLQIKLEVRGDRPNETGNRGFNYEIEDISEWS